MLNVILQAQRKDAVGTKDLGRRPEGTLVTHCEDSLLDDVCTFPELRFVDDQRRRQPDDVAVCGLRQDSLLHQPQAQLPGIKFCEEKSISGLNFIVPELGKTKVEVVAKLHTYLQFA